MLLLCEFSSSGLLLWKLFVILLTSKTSNTPLSTPFTKKTCFEKEEEIALIKKKSKSYKIY